MYDMRPHRQEVYTVVLGMLAGSFVAALRARRREVQA
jgi:hypothetical protein